MTTRRIILVCGFAIGFSFLLGCSDDSGNVPSKPTPGAQAGAAESNPAAEGVADSAAESAPTAKELAADAKEMFGALPVEALADGNKNPLTPEKVALGRVLFHDPRLSRKGKLSCATCHDPAKFGVDGRATPIGPGGKAGRRNAPSVLNAALQTMQFWDGRSKDVEEQARMALLNPEEMGNADEKSVLAVLLSIPGYAPLFAAAFPAESESLTFANMTQAIGAFERKLTSPAPFDRFLAGELDALTTTQIQGLSLFVDAGCVSCHLGRTVGGMMVQKLGLIKPYPTKDKGRYEVAEEDGLQFFFKVPQLRNVSETGPYLHDGSIKTLDQVIRLMAEYQLGRKLKDDEVAVLSAFMASLTGKVNEALASPPKLPK